MKKQSLLLAVIFAGGTLLLACKKNETLTLTTRTEVTNAALLKIGYFTPTVGNPAAQLKINGDRVSPNLFYNTPFPGGGLNTAGLNHSDYLGFPPGKLNFGFSIPKSGTSEDSVKLLDITQELSAKRYTLFVTDSFPNMTSVLVEDDVASPTDSGKVRIKFVNLIPDAGAVDLYREGVKIASDIPYKGVTEYTDIFAGNFFYFLKLAGTNTTINVAAGNRINPVAGRVYTFFCRGWRSKTSGALMPNVSAMIVK